MAALGFWATHFPARELEHYVFPTERYGAAGDVFCAKAYNSDPTKPIGSIKEAWEAAKLRAARILKGEPDSTAKVAPLPCRFHDLRHTAVSRMLNAGVPIAKVAKIVGWSTATMVRMAARYGHFTLDELRGAMDSISSAGIQTESPVFSPVSEDASVVSRPN
jgi:integrase